MTEQQSFASHVVQLGMFGDDRRHRSSSPRPKKRLSCSSESCLVDTPLLDPLREISGRGRPSERPVGMASSTWLYWRRWAQSHGVDPTPTPESMAQFLSQHRLATLRSRRSRLSEASREDARECRTWRVVRAWKDLSATEEAEWRRRIRTGQTDGIYRLNLRGLQRLEVVR